MSMRRTALALPFVLLSACAFAQTRGNGVHKEEARQVGDFQRVHVGSGLKATVTPGPTSVKVSGDEDLLALVETRVEDGELEVGLKRGTWNFRGDVHITISSPKVVAVEASGGGSVDAQATAQSRFQAEASGGGTVKVRGVDSGKVEAEASGGGTVTLRGHADVLKAEASGGGEVHADELEVATLEVEASGGGTVEAGPTKRVSGELSGGSVVHLSRAPAERDVETSGGAEVRVRK